MFRTLALALSAAGMLLLPSATADAQESVESSTATTTSASFQIRSSRVINPFAFRASKRGFGFLNLFRTVAAPTGVSDSGQSGSESAAAEAAALSETAAPVVSSVQGASGGSESVAQAASGRPSYRPPVRSPYRPPPRPPF